MNLKSAFLNGVIQEEVYVRQPSCFKSHKYPDRVYKLLKALYGLKQASRIWYVMGSVDRTLFTLNHGTDFFTCSDLR
jgi:hypothetical protein